MWNNSRSCIDIIVSSSSLQSRWIHGIVVSGIILYGAYGLLRDMINSLIGEAPDPELVHNIVDMIMAHPAILGVHDMMLHNYGPNKIFASAHVEGIRLKISLKRMIILII